MVKPTIDALTATVPQLGQSAAEFDANTNDFLPQLVPLQDQINVAIDWTDEQVTAVDAGAAAALLSEAGADNAAFDANQSATEAADSAALAISGGAAAAGADVHVPNAAYTASNPASAAVSNVDGQTYRCIVAHDDVATDPANDATRWVRISFTGDYDDLNNKPTVATAAQVRSLTTPNVMTPEKVLDALASTAPSGGANFAPDWSAFIAANWVVTANRTLSNPTNVIPGSTRSITIKASTATERTIAFGSNYKGDLPTVAVTNAAFVTLFLYAVSATEILVSDKGWS